MERKQQRHGEGFNAKKLWRAALFASTGLSAVLSIPAIARAQTAISSDTTPQGGVVVGGSASIAQAPSSTTINQSSERAAINWQSFDVGSGAKVQFNQPDASAIALNRVVGGNLSQINGQINANGQIVLINQSGVVFGKGSQVNAENIVVSTSDIATKDFMAGNMAFTGAPNPGAKIINQGNITVKDTGLVGLIAPQVENDGVITARLGQVILAGASAFTLDMYGDRLISLDVTKAVQAVDVGGKLVPALVTNRGVILADGGKVLLTAQDADALVTQLIDAGGTIRANSVGGQTGTISLQGVGGDINIAGNLLAKGTIGSAGGAIEALTTGTVAVASGADIDASGDTGGGVIAIGTNLLRAAQGKSDITAPKAAAVNIAAGATLAADATGKGNGGTVALLSSRNTQFGGLISVRGGPNGGNGGAAEISSDGVISLSGTVLATAINGKPGEIVLDPATLVVSNGVDNSSTFAAGGNTTIGSFTGGVNSASTVNNGALDLLSGSVTLEAGSFITVANAISMASATALSLVSEGSVVVSASIQVNGSLEIDAATSLAIGAGLTASNILLTSGAAGTEINGGVTAATGTVALGSGGTVFEGSTGSIISSVLLSHGSIGGGASLSGGNTIATLDGFTLGGTLNLANSGGLTVGGSVSAANVSLSAGSLTFESGVKSTGVLSLSSTGTIFQGAGTIAAGTLTGNSDGLTSFTRPGNAIGTLGAFSVSGGGTLALNDAGSLDIDGNVLVLGGTLALGGTSGITQTGGIIDVGPGGTLVSLGSIGGNVSLVSNNNTIGSLGGFTVGGDLDLADKAPLSLNGSVSGANITLNAHVLTFDAGVSATNVLSLSSDGDMLQNGGTITAGTLTGTDGGGSSRITLALAGNDIGTLGAFSLNTGGTFALNDGVSLDIDGDVILTGPSGTLALGGTSGITQTGGSISADTLISLGSIGGNVSLASDNNAIGTLGGFTVGGNLDLNNLNPLALNGSVSGANITLETGPLTIGAGVSATGVLSLLANGGISQTGGTITAGTLTGNDYNNIGNVVSLADAGNDIGTLGAFMLGSDGTFALNDSVSLDIAGEVTASLGTVALGGTSGITEAGGLIDVGPGTLISLGSIGGNVSLTGNNAIGTLGGFTVGGNLDLADDIALTAVGNVAAGDVTIAGAGLSLASGVSISANADMPSLALAADTISLGGSNTFLAGNGTISITPFSGGTTIDIGSMSSPGTLGLPGSLISALDSTASTYVFGSGPVGVRAAGIDIDAGASFAGTATVDLSTSGTIFDNLGSLVTGTLFFSAPGGVTQANGAGILANLVAGTAASGNVLLGSDANTIVSLGSVSVGSGGTLALVDAGTLTIAGAIDPAVVTLYGAAGLVIDNDVSASSQVSLGSTGNVVQTAGSITTPTLASIGSIGGDATLTSATNSIGTIAGFTLGGTLDLANAGSLTVGTVDAGNITLSAGGIGFTGAVTSSNVLALASTGDITQTGGSITAPTLASIGAIGGDARLVSLTNDIGTLSNFSATGTIALGDSVLLQAPGTIAAPVVSLNADGITITGAINAPTELALGGGGTIEQKAGSIDAGALVSIGTIGGHVYLGYFSTKATVSSIGNFSLTSDFSLNNQASADITGVISTPANVEFDGGGVTETGAGAIAANGIDTNVQGDVLLTGSNTIASIDFVSAKASGTFALNDIASLAVTGSVAASDVTLAAPTIALASAVTIAATAATPALALASDEIDLGGGNTFRAGNGTISVAPFSAGTAIDFGSVSSAGTLGLPGSLVSAFDGTAAEIVIGKGPVGHRAGSIGIDNSVSFSGTSIVDLSTSGLILQKAGTFGAATLEFDSAGFTQASGATISAMTLAGDGTPITGSVLLVGANTISTLDGISLSTGTFALVDTGSLDSVGSLSAPIVTLSADTLGLNGTISAPTLLALGGGSITETGSISTATLTSLGSIGGDATLTGTNSIGTLGAFMLGGTLSLADSSSLAVAGTVDGSYITLAAPGIGFTGNVTSSNELALESTGSITQSAGSLAAGDLASIGTIGGNVSLANTANSFGDIGDFASAGTIDLAAGTLASSNGATISAPVVSLSAASFDLAGLVNAPTKLAIGGGETGNAADLFNVYAGSLVSIGTIEGGVNLGFEDPSTVAAIGNFSLTGNFFLPNAISAQLTGLLSTPDGTVEYDGGGITETSAGAIDASHFNTNLSSVGPITGDVLLTGSNTISSIDSFGVGASGTVALNNTVSLAVNGEVTGSDVTIATPTIGLNNALDATLAGGTIAVAADALTIGSGGSFVTDGGTIALAPQTPGYGVDIGGNAANDLDITGALATAFPAGTADIIIGRALGSLASSIAIDAPVTFSSNILQLSASGTITDNSTLSANTLAFDAGGFFQAVGGTVDATLLRGDGFAITGPVVLNGANNSIATLGSIATPSDLRINDTAALGVTGPVNAQDIYLTDSNTGGINIAGSVVASSGGTIGLVSDALTASSGTISAPGGLVYLSPYTLGNSIDLGGTGGDLNLSSGFIDLISSKVVQIGTVNGGAITQDSAVSLASSTLVLAGSSIDFAGTLAVPALLTFASAGDVSEGSNATISVPALTGTAGGTIGLVGGNAIGTLDALSAGGNVTVNNIPSIIIAGLVSGGAITLDDGSNVTEIAGGGLSAGTLGGSIGGNAFLTTGNTIALLDGLTVDGILLFNNAGGGPLDLGNITTGNASFAADGITIAGLLDIGGGADDLGLFSTGGITEASAAGIIEAGKLYGTDSGGQVSLGSANSIASLGSFAAGNNNVSLNNAIGLDIAGQVTIGGGNYLVLTGTSLTESAGLIDAGTLAGSFSTGVSLAAANGIGTLGAFTLSAGTLTLNDTGLLDIAGPVKAPRGTLVAPTIAIAGTVTATDALALESTGNVYETTGSIATASLTTGGGTIGGFASFGNGNSITGLGSFAVTGDLTLVDGGSLAVSGPVSAAGATLSADGIGIGATIGAAVVSLASSAGITETGAGIIDAGLLTGTSAETVALLNGNSIVTLGGFAVDSGDFGVSNTSALLIGGLVSAPGTITLEGAGAGEITGGTLAAAVLDSGGTTLAGDVTLGKTNYIGTLGGFTLAAGTLVLADAGAPSLDLGGTVVAPFATLTANTIGGTGTLFGTEATLSAGSIDIGGLVSLASDLALESSGNVSESTGTIFTPLLTSGGTTIGGNATLARAANLIGTLGGFTLGGTLDLADAGTLTIAGPAVLPAATISASSIDVAGTITGGTDTLSAGGIDIRGSISLATLLALVSTGGITEPGGFITVPTLSSGGTTIGGNVTLADANSIGTLGGFTVGSGGTLDLTDAGLLTIAGPVAAPFATLTADTLSVTGAFTGTTATFASGGGGMGVTGSISLATLLALASDGAVTESGAGAISAGTLVSAGPSINGNVLLANTLNSIGTLGGFTIGAGDTLLLGDAGLLTIYGPVVATYSTFDAGAIAVAGALGGASQTLSAGGDIVIEAAISVTNDLALETPGNVTETTGGTITAGTLTTGGTSIGGNATLASFNSIGTLGGVSGFTIGGTLDLADLGSPTLAIAGNVMAATSTLTANTIASLPGSGFSGTSATFSAGSIDIGGLVSLTSELALASGGSITESTGTIDVPTLISVGPAIGGAVQLTNDTNNIGTLGGFTVAGGALALDDNGLLTVAGPVSAPDAALSAGSISITGAISIGQTLALATSAGGVDESTGQITAAVLTTGATTIQGTVALINGNAINTLSNFAATGYIILDNTPALTIDGYVATPQKLTLDESGGITEAPGGTLAVGTLSSGNATTGDVALGNANSIVTLGGFTVGAGDTLALNDTGTLTIAGPVAAPFATISSGVIAVTGSVTGGVATLSAGSIGIDGSISLATLLALESSSDITETGGFVTVPTLTSGGTNIGGNVTLGDANSIASLGSFTETGTLILTDAGALTVAGPVNTGNATLTADGILLPGSIATGTLALLSGGDVAETGGRISAALLIGTVSSGSATLQGTNTIATLGSFTVTAGTLALADTGLLTVTGPVSAPTTTLASNAIEVAGTMSGTAATLTAGSIDISGLITATGNIALESTGNVTEADGGVLATPLLTSGGTTIGGNALLTGTGNGIGTLGAFAAAGTLTLDDTGLLTVRGPVNAPITTLSSGSIAITGSIDAATALALESTGSITEPGGFITTPTLTSGGTPVGGNVSLTDVNAIGTLAGFTDDGTFILDDSGLLTAAGPVVAPVVTLSSPTIAITGNVHAATLLALRSTGNVFEGANGAIDTGTLTGAAGGDVTLNTAFNGIGTLGAFGAAGLALDDQTPLAITAPVSIAGVLALLDTGNVTQTGGTITAATLTSDNGTIGGAASLTQPGNDISLLGDFGAVAGLALTDAVPLNLAGNIFTGTAPLTLLDAGNPITQAGGAISTGTLNATGGDVTLGQANAIGDLGNVDVANLYVNGVAGIGGPVVAATFATILSPGALPVSGNISAGGNLVLEALGDISQTGGSITSGPSGSATFIAGGAINLSGAISVADQLDLVAGGNILHPAGQLAAGTLAGSVGGYVTTALGTVMGSGALADFAYSSLTTDIGTIGNFIMHDSTFALNNDGPLAIVGSLVADVILITTNGSLTLVGSSDGSAGGIFINSGSIATTAYFSPHPTDSVINVDNGGVFQTGTFAINTANGPPGTLFLYVDNGGIQFAAAPDELFAPFINLEISDPGGVIAGNVNLDRLVILDAGTKSVQLTGTLDGLQGQAAASKGIVDPFPRPEFQFNACPIGSVNCTILPIESLPPGNPLENFDLTQRKRKKLDKNVHLPGVATRDF